MPQAKFLQFEHFSLNKEPEALNLPLVGEPKLFTISNFIMIKVFDKDNKFIFLLYLFIFSILSSKREKVFICFSILYEKLVKLCPFMFWTNFHNLPKLCSFMFWKNGFKNKNFKLCSFMFWNNEGIKCSHLLTRSSARTVGSVPSHFVLSWN